MAVQGRLFVKLCQADKPISANGSLSTDYASALEVECPPENQTKSRPAREFDVVVGDKHFGVNWNGEYYIVLNRLSYSGLMLRGGLPVRVYNRDGSFHELHTVAFNRVDQNLEDLTLPSRSTLFGDSRGMSLFPAGAFLKTSAWAQQVQAASRKALLFLTAVKLVSSSPRLKEGRWELHQNGVIISLQAGGTGAGATTPLLAGQSIALEKKYYFSVSLSEQSDSRFSGEIVLHAEAGFFLTYTERFPFSRSTGEEATFTLHGDRGSELELLLSLPVATNLGQKATSIKAETCNEVSDIETCHKSYLTGCSHAAVPRYDAYLNLLKNQLPSPNLENSKTLTNADFASLDREAPLALGRGNHAEHAEMLASIGEGTIVSTIGYLYRAEEERAPETANCQLTGPENANYTLYIGFDSAVDTKLPGAEATGSRELSKSSIVAVVTPHYRARHHPKWTIARLRQAVGMQVKVVGQLLMNNPHYNPHDNCGHPDADRERCWRASAWELHPVTQLYVCNSRMGCAASAKSWELID